MFIAIMAITPNQIQQFSTGINTARVMSKLTQQIKFFRGEINGFLINKNLAACFVDGEFTICLLYTSPSPRD